MGNAEMDWETHLHNAKNAAETAEEGDMFFLQVKSPPLVAVWIETGKKLNDKSEKRNTSLTFVKQHNAYPPIVPNREDIFTHGYEKFKSCVKRMHYTRIAKKRFEAYTLDDYKCHFQSLTDDIDNSIREFHGVVCYKDNNITNKAKTNIYFLHICDIFNVLVALMREKVPTVQLKSSLLQELPNGIIINDFRSIQLKKENFDLLVTHIDVKDNKL
jgi:hypothetical protein